MTAVGGASGRFTPFAAASLTQPVQPLPEGWEVEWCVAFDGPDAAESRQVKAALQLHPNAQTVTLNRSHGATVARTAALTKATGELIYVLDADDVIPDLALADLVEVFQDHPETRWTAGHGWIVIDSRHDIVEARTGDIPRGLVPANTLNDFYDREHRCPFPPAQVMVRTEDVFAVGGYPALPCNADCAMLLQLDRLGPGWLVPGLHLLSRRHPDQASGEDAQWEVAKAWLERRAR